MDLRRQLQKLMETAGENSLIATADDSTLAKIFEGMARADEDLQAKEEWAKHGFVARPGYRIARALRAGR